MKNTSLGYHTISLNLKMNSLDFSIVEGDFIRYADHQKKIYRGIPLNMRKCHLGGNMCTTTTKGSGGS